MRDNKSAYNSNIYDEHIVSVLPYYKEYHRQIIELVESLGKQELKWLDTGCGTGTLAKKALESIPHVNFTLCDPSDKMLNEARIKLDGTSIRFMNIPSQELTFDSEFDVVTAVQCHHYFKPDERKVAVQRCFNALKNKGVFVTFENIRMSTEESDAIALKRWADFLEEKGNSDEDVRMHIERRGVEVFPITVEQHIELLESCGFSSVNVLWASYLQAGFWAIK